MLTGRVVERVKRPRTAFAPLSWPLLAWLLLFTPASPAANLHKESENKIKAALVFKMLKYVHWPELTLDKPGERLDICVLGNTPVASLLAAVEGRRVHNLRLAVREIRQTQLPASGCEVVFIGASEVLHRDAVLNTLGRRPVLTISDMDAFARNGGMIQLSIINQSIAFVVNLKSVQNSGLRIDTSLLQVAADVLRAGDNRDRR